MSEVMFFGKHKGRPLVEVNTRYLIWCATKLRKCPAPVIAELERRGALTGLHRLKCVRTYMKRKGGVSHIKPSTAVGSHYQRLRCDWAFCGGDESACPFDADGYIYRGPTVHFALGIPYIGGEDADTLSDYAPE